VFAIWARLILGRNWSGVITLKERHELIERGPYRVVRHPIYTGILAMIAGTAIALGYFGGFVGSLLVFVSFWVKLKREEDLMLKHFPAEYAAYQRRVKRIIPFLV
jgi:protein-S-isoprenylcysteine O-methyltransferase Ste14